MAIQFDNTNTGTATLRPATTGTIALTLPSADGTSGQAITTNGSGQLAFTTVGGGGGLTGFTAAESTSAPNATVNVDSLTASAASTDADVAFVAKGAGATLAQVPDSTTTGGNKRGQYATDWQKSRAAADQVASGNYSVVAGGQDNRASGDASIVSGGRSNIALNNQSIVVGGEGNTSQGARSAVVGGTINNASATNSIILGCTNAISNSNNSSVLGGSYGSTRSITAYTVFPGTATIAASVGVTQTALSVLGKQTTDATPGRLTSNGAASGGTTNQVILPNNSAYYFRGEVIAGVTGAGDTKGWYVEGVIKRGANAASTALVGTPTVTSSYADAGASAWTITATADTTNGGLAITVTGAAATTIRWVAQIRTTEMTY
jgi:hypothetical protein